MFPEIRLRLGEIAVISASFPNSAPPGPAVVFPEIRLRLHGIVVVFPEIRSRLREIAMVPALERGTNPAVVSFYCSFDP